VTLNIIPCGNDRFDELVAFVARLNHEGRHHIGYFGVSEADIRSSLAECVIPPAEGFHMAYENNRLTGIFGVDADPEIDRAWLFGPIIESRDWQAIADQLLAAATPVIPSNIHEHELFCDVNNTDLIEFARRHDFPLHSETAIFDLLRNDYKRPAKIQAKVIAYHDTFFSQFESLHKTLFPKAYFTAKQIVSKLDDEHRLFITVADDRLGGYHFCKIEPEARSGYVDFIGVDSSARGRGLGADLLAAGLDWMFAAPSTGKVNLTVNADNKHARRLYKNFGFRSERVMRGYRKQVS
jgi:ribosomal protein S18 acetylase RimI-like enzyme